ncbi:ABC transporter substrate-binding protein [Lentibacillus amyloliquefaciens]|uniref:Ferrichrome ABC transporter substrate-binding protein n=1 Tax=Lentibacillus amyloliquefaciens TaxID=1472767 RepID=A0A0U4DPN2_9BACI|nr:iron-siderophore ABC transporter substrate-binding protein [Lentibacillus amyloliquefaciens]ALX47288.1 ferrichrome ABC transporter substrate-binding protein [Lentibacillus amyloliquefaciens]
MKKPILMSLALLLLILTACGGNDNSSEENNEADSGEADNSDRTVTIEDAMGEQTIEGTPENIVALEWTYAENLLALGIQPAGVADLEGFDQWVNIDKEFGDSVQDVGTRQEPNLEAIRRQDPELIIAVKFRHEQYLDQLKDIAPVVTFAPYGEEAIQDHYQNMINEMETLAKIVDKQKEAEQAVSDLNSFIDEQKQRIEEAGLEGSQFLATQAFTAQNTPTLRLFTANSMVGQIMNKLGLENVYETEEPEVYGYSEVTLEALQNFQDNENLQFLYIVQEDDNIFESDFKGNPAWENLSFVQNGNTHQLPGDTWTFGGVLSNQVLTEQLVDAMVNE